MEDFERYGDYNDIDDGGEKKRSIAVLIVKLLTAFVWWDEKANIRPSERGLCRKRAWLP